jgi:ActR/RegA family two-component response regulator
MDRPLNVMVVSQDDLLIDKLTSRFFDRGYNLIASDLRDVFLSYKEIGYHIILIENEFKDPRLHKDDVGDPDFPGLPLPVTATINKLRERKENVRVVSWAPEYNGLSDAQLAEKAAKVGADAAIGKPGDLDEVIELFESLLARKPKEDSENPEDDDEIT